MSDAIAWLVPALGAALLAFLWQGALVGMAAWAALHALRHARAQLRYAVACAALLLCVALPLGGVLQALVADAGPGSAPAPASATLVLVRDTGAAGAFALPRVPAPPADLLPWIVALWACGAALLSLRMACGLAWVRRARRAARPEAGPWQACMDALALKLGVRTRVCLRLCADGDGPVVAGWWKPVVLLPVAVLARVPAPLLEALLAHELAHVRRHDYLVNLLQGVAEALLFHHPVTWWLSRRIRIERELVADDLAARALGDRRRLALALSELDRVQAVPARAFPPPHIAPAAHGGHLMSRIRQLIRPDARTPRAAAALPALVLLATGMGAWAHARNNPQPAAQPAPRVQAVAQAAGPATADGIATPAARPQPRAAQLAADAPAATARARTARTAQVYALVRGDRAGIVMSGSTDDIDDIRAPRRGPDDEYLWFRRDGKAWVVRDADTLRQAREARRQDDALEAQMRALDARMRPHSERMQAMGRQMDALSGQLEGNTPAMQATSGRMEALSRQMEALSREQSTLASQLPRASDDQRAALEAKMEALNTRQQALSDQMERHSATMDRASREMERKQAPMEALGRQMEAEGKPMEAIGQDMQALGTRIQAQAEVSGAAIAQLIDQAWARGLAEPAQRRQ